MFAATIRSRPQREEGAMIQSSSLEAPYQAQFSDGAHSAVADVPVGKGGRGQGFGPHDLLEAALATCMCMTARTYAEKHGWPLTGVRSAVRIDRGTPGEATLHYSLEFDGPLSAVQTEVLLEAAGNCPVARTLTGKLAVRRGGPVEE
jgi:putative redox protein